MDIERNKSSDKQILLRILEEFGIEDPESIRLCSGGRINETFVILTRSSSDRTGSGDKYVLQKLHKIFDASLLSDIESITARLTQSGIATPRLVKTLGGELGVDSDGELWRMTTYVPGKTYEKGISPEMAGYAAALVGGFHNSLASFQYEFRHKIPDFHDTKAIMQRLREVEKESADAVKRKALSPFAKYVMAEWNNMRKTLDNLPDRIVHGDLKLNNVRFDTQGADAVALLDLDTLSKHKIVVDIGDAVRSWCKCESDVGERVAVFDLEIFGSFMKGYINTATFLVPEEIRAIPEGTATMMLELSARYIIDAFEESYFTLDNSRYRDLFEQNISKVEEQIGLYEDFQRKRPDVDEIVKSYM